MDMGMCEECGTNPSTVHLTQMIDGETSSFHLCADCARDKGISISFDGAEVEFINDSSEQNSAETVRCPVCALELTEFKTRGTLGCPACYRAFEKEIGDLFVQMHGNACHKGKSYGAAAETVDTKKDLETLKLELENAIRNEKFELAASIRDKIRGFSIGGKHKDPARQ